MTITPKAGDVMADGTIAIGGGKAARGGVVIIPRSRLRRARRFGWELMPAGFQAAARIEPGKVIVGKEPA
jgi:hypothetical protein